MYEFWNLVFRSFHAFSCVVFSFLSILMLGNILYVCTLVVLFYLISLLLFFFDCCIWDMDHVFIIYACSVHAQSCSFWKFLAQFKDFKQRTPEIVFFQKNVFPIMTIPVFFIRFIEANQVEEIRKESISPLKSLIHL